MCAGLDQQAVSIQSNIQAFGYAWLGYVGALECQPMVEWVCSADDQNSLNNRYYYSWTTKHVVAQYDRSSGGRRGTKMLAIRLSLHIRGY